MFDGENYYFGEFTHTLDSQRRIAIPSEWRSKQEESRFIMLPGRDALMLIPFASFREFLKKAQKVSFANRKAQLALAQIGARVQECTCDKQGRIKVSQKLLDPYGISEQAILVGAFTSIQMWNPEHWNRHQDGAEGGLDELQRIGESPDGFMNMFQETMEKLQE
ncbi:MAG: hypothetical protein PHQ27_06500 [Victivallales bacterium]|nr:hypothetical protein [Victivallales bacterium]